MSEDFGVGFKKFFTDLYGNLKSDNKKEAVKAGALFALGFLNPAALLVEGVIKGFTGMGSDSLNLSNDNVLFGNGQYSAEDYKNDIKERPWQAVDISSITDLSLLDDEENFPKEKLMAMATHYSLGDQELTPEAKQYLEKKLGITINDPASEETQFSSINSSLLTPNVIKTLSDEQLLTLLKGYQSGTQELTELQYNYILARNIVIPEETDEATDEATAIDRQTEYTAFDPTQMTIEQFKETYSTPESLEEIVQKYEEGTQSLSPEMKAYIEETLGRKLNDFDYTSLDITNMTLDDFKALNYDNYQLELIQSQYQVKGEALPEEISNYILESLTTISFDPTQITIEQFKETYSSPTILEKIAQNYEAGTQSLSPEMKAYIEETIGRELKDFDYTSLGYENMSLDDFKALNYDNYQLKLIQAQYSAIEQNLSNEIIEYISEVLSIDTTQIEQTEEEKEDEPKLEDVKEEIPDIKPSGNNPFGIGETFSLTNNEIKTISSDSLINIQQSTLEEYIELYDKNPDLIQFADEHSEAQFMQLYNDFKADYRKESEDLPEEVKNKLEANAGGTGTT